MDDSFHRLMQLDVIKDYKRVMIDGLQNSFTSLSRAEIEEAIDWSIANRHVNKPAQINNNYTKQQVNGTVIDILNYIQQLEPIVTSSGVLYKKHQDAVNPLDVMIQGFLKQRDNFKTKMKHYPKASHEFEKYNLLQLLEKLNGNATYGIPRIFIFYATLSWQHGDVPLLNCWNNLKLICPYIEGTKV